MLWIVDDLLTVPGIGIMAKLSQMGGVARLTVEVSQLGHLHGFRRLDEPASVG
ncbi:MAG: hypothetical protein ACM31L_10655 [Actinomycetota bacterium]